MVTNKNTMAAFGQGFVQTQVISENGAVKYKLSVSGSNANSEPNHPYVMLNDEPLGSQEFPRGLNVRVIDVSTNQVIDSKVFDLGKLGIVAATAFTQYMNGLASGLVVCILTSERCYSDTILDAWFRGKGSKCWPNTGMCKEFPNTSYAAFFLTKESKIAMDHVFYNDGVLVEDSLAPIEVVYDKLDDIGATGFPGYVIWDPTEYRSEGQYEFKKYPETGALVVPLSKYNIKPGDTIALSFELFADKELDDAGGNTRINLRWIKGTTWKTGSSYDSTYVDAYQRFDRIVTVPTDIDGFIVIAAKYPQSVTVGESAVKNFTMTQVSRGDESLGEIAEFGVNGIKMNKAVDAPINENPIMELLNLVDDSEVVTSSEFREFGKSY